jgi:DNA-binding beta-propeller fold protein YncE
VYITDTGNKRVVIFNSEGEFIAEFGKGGFDPGEFDEPVGIAVDGEGLVYVADTWNKRIQVMLPDASGTNYQPLYNFDISGWKGQSLENKPFITLDGKGNLLVADPEKGRVLVFDTQGNYRWGWTVYSPVNEALGVLSGIAVDPEGYVWVSDSADAIMLKYDISNLPPQGGQPDVSLPSPTSQSEGGQ